MHNPVEVINHVPNWETQSLVSREFESRCMNDWPENNVLVPDDSPLIVAPKHAWETTINKLSVTTEPNPSPRKADGIYVFWCLSD